MAPKCVFSNGRHGFVDHNWIMKCRCSILTNLGTFKIRLRENFRIARNAAAAGIRRPQKPPELFQPAKTLNSFLQPKKAGRIVVQNISFLFRRKFGIGLNGVNRHRDCIGPDHFVGTEHDALLESRVN